MSAPAAREALLRVLDEARSLVRLGWTQRGPAARLGGGVLVDPEDPIARAWSPLGALRRAVCRAGHGWESPFGARALRALRDGILVDFAPGNLAVQQAEDQRVLCHLIANWNDDESRTQRHAILAFDRAIGLVAQSQKKPPTRKETAA